MTTSGAKSLTRSDVALSSDEAVDLAIKSMADEGAVAAFEAMQPPLRAAVRRRLLTLTTIVVANEAGGNPAVSVVPRGFPKNKLAMALLLTMGRVIPLDVRAKIEKRR